MIQRIYIDTSVIGGCEDDEFREWSIQLMEEFRQGLRIAVISDLTQRELESAPESVKQILSTLPEKYVKKVFLNREAEVLANTYIVEEVISIKYIADAQHIAIATIERVDILVSWNFLHIVNIDRIHAFNSVNIKLGYPILEIRSPREVVHEKEV